MPLHNTVPETIKNSHTQCTISCFTFYQFPLFTPRLKGVNLTRHEIFKGRDLLIHDCIRGRAHARCLLDGQTRPVEHGACHHPSPDQRESVAAALTQQPCPRPKPIQGHQRQSFTSQQSLTGLKEQILD